MIHARLLLTVLVTSLALATSLAGELKEDPAEARAREIAKELRCAVCQNQSVYDSNSDLAKDMLKIIREKVNAGESQATIRDYFHQRYGDYIYLEPTHQGSNLLLWVGPFLGLLVGGWALFAALQRWRPRENPPAATNSPPTPGADAERIRKELDDIQL